MPETFLISDTHFGHERILEFEPVRAELAKTIQEHDEELVARWNRTVRPKDTVWHLGDVLFGAHNFGILGRLNGYKKLVKGNHDHFNANRYLEHFADVQGAVKMDDLLFTHIPIHESQKYRFRGNVHGHLHSKTLDDPFYFNVSCERINFTPIPLHIVKKAFGPE